MLIIDHFFTLALLVQILHALEELVTGFHRRWYLKKLPLWFFIVFDVLFLSFWVYLYFQPAFPQRQYFQAFFLIFMFANGIEHLVWSRINRCYTPGLITAPLHIVIFSVFFFQALFQ